MFETALAFPQDPVYIVKERKFPEKVFVSSEMKSTQQIFDLNIFLFYLITTLIFLKLLIDYIS